jgi:hypothetical protein
VETPGKRYRLPGPDVFHPGAKVPWEVYRKKTGVCESCGRKMRGHEKCSSCGALCGIGHQSSSLNYRGKRICGVCMMMWKAAEDILHRDVDFKEFIHGVSLPKE